ncbi:hypothetical protein VNO77_46230 [Canavalia gladiata]|uniref:Uncharacterized protein n=1 Tax=Canavalia gladiata TaxID=3824 RepID=A0AAN9PGZ4_CANGL
MIGKIYLNSNKTLEQRKGFSQGRWSHSVYQSLLIAFFSFSSFPFHSISASWKKGCPDDLARTQETGVGIKRRNKKARKGIPKPSSLAESLCIHGIVYKITAAFRSDLSLPQKQAGSDPTFEREFRRGGVHIAPIALPSPVFFLQSSLPSSPVRSKKVKIAMSSLNSFSIEFSS